MNNPNEPTESISPNSRLSGVLKLTWKVAEPPTGRFRSFAKRYWPTAYYDHPSGEIAVNLTSESDYVPADVKTGNHDPIYIHIANHSVHPFRWLRIKIPAKTLEEAKKRAYKFLLQNPHLAGQG